MAKKNTVVLSLQEALAIMKSNIKFREVKEEDIDYSDIPRLTKEPLKLFKPMFPKSKLKKSK